MGLKCPNYPVFGRRTMRALGPHERLTRPAVLIGAALGLGASDPRCGQGPHQLLAGGLLAHLSAQGADVLWRVTLQPQLRRHKSRDGAIVEFCARLAREVSAVVGAGDFPIVLGGDHSCAIGTWSGAAKALSARGPLGLVWIDAHMDSHTPSTSPSGMLHGMPLAALLGRGADPELARGAGGPLAPQHLCLVGVRSYESEEAALLAELGVKIFLMTEIEERGIDAVLDDAVRIASTGTAGYGISIDLDAIEPSDAPGVGTPVAGGIPAAGLIAALRNFSADHSLLGLEVVEYNPHLDRGRKTAMIVEEILAAVLGAPAASARSPEELERSFGARNYDSLPVVLVRGRGAYLWDDHGRRYLDLMSAYSAVSHGHCHPRTSSRDNAAHG